MLCWLILWNGDCILIKALVYGLEAEGSSPNTVARLPWHINEVKVEPRSNPNNVQSEQESKPKPKMNKPLLQLQKLHWFIHALHQWLDYASSGKELLHVKLCACNRTTDITFTNSWLTQRPYRSTNAKYVRDKTERISPISQIYMCQQFV